VPTGPDDGERYFRLVDTPEEVRPGEEVKTLLTMTDTEFSAYLALLADRAQSAEAPE
jgi:hypothetical protein